MFTINAVTIPLMIEVLRSSIEHSTEKEWSHVNRSSSDLSQTMTDHQGDNGIDQDGRIIE
jgi:hypothetical protein